MQSAVLVKKIDLPDIDLSEVARYTGVRELDDDYKKLILKCYTEVQDEISAKVSYRRLCIKVSDGEVDFGYFKVKSSDLAKNLRGAKEAIVFASTIGIAIDRKIKKYSKVSQTCALVFQGIGAERIETAVNLFDKEIKNEIKKHGQTAILRFSPGYGDFSLEHQREIFFLLDCERKIGLTLNDSMLMSPSKSVTGVIGIKDGEMQTEKSGCAVCKKEDCQFRRRL